MFGSSGRMAWMERELKALTTERDDLTARLSVQDATVWNLQQELKALKDQEPQPANLSQVAVSLRGFVPTIEASGGYALLRQAKTPTDFAQGIHVLMRDAHRVGLADAQKASQNA